jgi:hypothetical protein
MFTAIRRPSDSHAAKGPGLSTAQGRLKPFSGCLDIGARPRGASSEDADQPHRNWNRSKLRAMLTARCSGTAV